MMNYVVRKPDFQVEIIRPDYNASSFVGETIAIFGANPSNKSLLSYNFSESLNTVDTNFSLTFTGDTDDSGYTWLDKIHQRDLVRIAEFGQTKFMGIVTDRRFTARIPGGKPNHTVSISGVALGNLLSTFPLVIDQFIYQGNTLAEQANQQLKAKLTAEMNAGQSVAAIMRAIYNSFFDLSLKMGSINQAGVGIKTVLDSFIDFDSALSEDAVLKYPLALSIFRVGTNNLWEILSNIVVPPVYELFASWESRRYNVTFRQAPFDPVNWTALPIVAIPSLYLTDHDFGTSDRQIYTYYLCTVAGSGVDDRKSMLLDSAGYGHLAVRDEEKWKKYGYRPLILEFRYFDKSKASSYTTTANTMQALSTTLYEWYRRNDEYATGTLKYMTLEKQFSLNKFALRNPHVGERLSFLEGEFYVEEVENNWTYGGAMETQLSLSRGYVYSKDGIPLKPIEGMGRRLNRLSAFEKQQQFEAKGFVF